MKIPNRPLSPGAVITAHERTLGEAMDALLTARAEAEQASLEAAHWKQRAEAAEAKLAETETKPAPAEKKLPRPRSPRSTAATVAADAPKEASDGVG